MEENQEAKSRAVNPKQCPSEQGKIGKCVEVEIQNVESGDAIVKEGFGSNDEGTTLGTEESEEEGFEQECINIGICGGNVEVKDKPGPAVSDIHIGHLEDNSCCNRNGRGSRGGKECGPGFVLVLAALD
ncbi:hypothetical protein U1Q18_008054 [Sarracenia purpurea var. burkii]